MAIIKKSELKNMNEAQLNAKMKDLNRELIKINSQIASGTPPQNPGNVREIKKTIARILTKLNQNKKRGEAKE